MLWQMGIMIGAILLFVFVAWVWPAIQEMKTKKAFSEIENIMNCVGFNEDSYNTDQLQVILSKIAKRIYIPSWYTKEDIGSLFAIHGVEIDSVVTNDIFEDLIEHHPITDNVTKILWRHVHKSLKITDYGHE